MNQILLSFLCGAAFLGGAATVCVILAIAWQVKDKTGRKEIKTQMEELLVTRIKTNEYLEVIANHYKNLK